MTTTTVPDPAIATSRRRWAAAIVLLAAVLAALLVLALATGGGGTAGPAEAAASIVPADALSYVNLSIDRSRPAVTQGLAVAARLPDFPLLGAAAISRFGAVLGGGHTVDFSREVTPWLGGEAALALLDTTTSTAGSLVIVAVADHGRAAQFVRSVGATARGSYRGRTLMAYPDGSELAFVGRFLVIGQDASVHAAIDVGAGAAPSLAADSAYRRAAATEPGGRVLDAYASPAGIRRVLAPQGGLLGALGDLLDQPALQGVALSVVPTRVGAQIRIHSALDASLTDLNRTPSAPFSPTLQDVLPAGARLALDVSGLDRVAPQVLNAGSAAGIAGGLGPLLSRLGSALSSEGVNVKGIVSIFHGETAVAITGGGRSPALVVVARTTDQVRAQTALAELESPLAQLFETKGAASAPVFNDRQIDGVTAHQIQLTPGLQFDYAVFRGLVVLSTSLNGIGSVAQQSDRLSHDSAFAAALGDRPKLVTSIVFADLAALLSAGSQSGLTTGSTYGRLAPDLQRIDAAGLSSTRSANASTTQISVRVR